MEQITYGDIVFDIYDDKNELYEAVNSRKPFFSKVQDIADSNMMDPEAGHAKLIKKVIYIHSITAPNSIGHQGFFLYLYDRQKEKHYYFERSAPYDLRRAFVEHYYSQHNDDEVLEDALRALHTKDKLYRFVANDILDPKEYKIITYDILLSEVICSTRMRIKLRIKNQQNGTEATVYVCEIIDGYRFFNVDGITYNMSLQQVKEETLEKIRDNILATKQRLAGLKNKFAEINSITTDEQP